MLNMFAMIATTKVNTFCMIETKYTPFFVSLIPKNRLKVK